MRRLTSGVTKSKVLLTLALVLSVALLAGTAFIGGVGEHSVPAAAVGENDVSAIGANGLQFGKNYLETDDHFYVSSGSRSTDTVALNAQGKAVSNPEVLGGSDTTNGNVKPTDGRAVSYAIKDKDTTVTATFSADFFTDSIVSTEFTVTVNISFVSEAGGTAMYLASDTFSVSAESAPYNGTNSISTELRPNAQQSDGTVSQVISMQDSGAHFRIEIINNSSSESPAVIKFRDPYISISSETIPQAIDAMSGIKVAISGTNRNPVYINDAFATGAMDNVFVKSGDEITLEIVVNATYTYGTTQTSKNASYSPMYNAAVGRAGDSCVDWQSVMENSSGVDTKTCLARSANQSEIRYPVNDGTSNYQTGLSVYYGFSATFVVGASSQNGTAIRIEPKLISGIDSDGNTSYFTDVSNEISIKIDNAAPASPILDTTKTLGLAIENGVWYTASNAFTLDYANAPEASNSSSAEFVYAMVVDKDYSGLMDGYDFTPRTSETGTEDYQYRAGSRTKTAKRYEVGDFSNASSATKKNVEFVENGEYVLILYAVDKAGNVSAATVYATIAGTKNVKVDASVRNVGADFLYNSMTVIPSKSNLADYNKYAYAYLCVGSEYHDADGNFTSKTDIKNTDTTNAGQNANEGYIAVKRGTWVTLRIVMTTANYNDYALIRFHNNVGMSRSDPSYNVGRDDCHIFDLTFQMTDAIWSGSTSGFPISVTFNRRVDIALNEADYVYSQKDKDTPPKTINLEFRAYFAKGDEQVTVQPDIGVEYYKTAKYYIYANFATLEDETIALTTGGKIEINNNEYTFEDTEDLRDYIAGRKSFMYTDYTGTHEYLAFGRSNPQGIYTDPETGKRYQLYEVQGYDLMSATTDGVTDAGTYYYRAYVITTSGNLPYYGELMNSFVVKKADPGVINLAPTDELTYGDSLGDLMFSSTDASGKRIETTVSIAGKVYQQVASGVLGEFVISSPMPGTTDYTDPDVSSSVKLEVIFNPIDVASFTQEVIAEYYDDFFKDYYERIVDDSGRTLGYTLIDGKQTASNYNSVTYIIYAKVNHKHAYVKADGDLNDISVTYDGTPKSVSPYAYISDDAGNYKQLDGVPIIVEYKLTTESDSAYTATEPTVAGKYNVRMRIDDTTANYVSDPEVVTLTILQRDLDIVVRDCDEHATVEETAEGTYIYTDTLTYIYGLESTAQYTAGYYGANEEWNVVDGVEFSLSFLKVYTFDASGNRVAYSTDVWTDSVSVISPRFLDAGVYILRVDVVNVNNAGTKYILFTVNQVALGNAANLSVATPVVRANYDMIYLSGVTQGKSGNLEYGQTLAEMRDAILGDGGTVKFTPRDTGVAETVSGRFYFETETEYAIRKGNSSLTEKNAAGNDILPVKYGDTGAILPYDINMHWQAGSYDENGNFIPDYNFRRESFSTSIYVVRAKADFTDFNLKTITYGQRVSETEFEGSVTSHGFVFGASDFTISVNTDYIESVPEFGENEIACTFIPSDDLIRKFIPIDDAKIKLYVQKREVTITFETGTVEPDDYDGAEHTDAVTFVYGNIYRDPSVTLQAVGIDGLDLSSIVLDYYYFRDKVEGETLAQGESIVEGYEQYVKIGGIDSTTPVGKYYVLCKIVDADGNYTGSAFNDVFVIRATLYYNGTLPKLSIEYGDSIADADFGTIELVNSESGNYSKMFSGSLKVAVKEGDTFVYDKQLGVTGESDTDNTYVIFVPTAASDAEYQANFRPFIKSYFLEVKKRDISQTVQVTSALESYYNGTDQSSDVKVYIPDPTGTNAKGLDSVLTFYKVVTDEAGNKTDVPVSVMTDAGEYKIVVGVNNEKVDNYTGSKAFTYTVKKAVVTILDEEVEFEYCGTEIEYVPSWDIGVEALKGIELIFVIEYTYVSDNKTMTLAGAPQEVGGYVAHVSVEQANITAQKDVVVYVAPIVDEYEGLEPVFNAVPEDGVKPIFGKAKLPDGSEAMHGAIKYTVEYKKQGAEDIEYSESVPTNVGKYDVLLTYDQNGYNKSFELDMVIAKAVATIEIGESYSKEYNGNKIALGDVCNITLPGGVTAANYYYGGEGETSFTNVAPTEAGTYTVKIELVDNNYEGEATTLLIIEQAELSIESTPVIDGKIEYGTAKSGVKFVAGTGSVKFRATGEEFTLKGTWAIEDDISTWYVGTYSVQISFTATDTRNFKKSTCKLGSDAGMAAESVRMNIVIQKRDISEFIALSDTIVADEDGNRTITYPYTSKGIGVNPYLTEGANLVAGAGTVAFAVYYNDMGNAPTAVLAGGYRVRVVINSANYDGTYEDDKLRLVITKATPMIVAPTIRDVDINTPLTADHIGADGYAYIENNGIMISVNGTFTLYGGYLGKSYDKANAQYVELLFTPQDTSSYNAIVFNTTVNVIGGTYTVTEDDIVVTSKSGSTVYYGAPLSAFEISVSSESSLATLGSVEWVDPDDVLHVGESAQYRFVPNDIDNYNIVVGTTSKVVIAKATLECTDPYAILYLGNAPKDAVLELSLSNKEHPGTAIGDYVATVSADGIGANVSVTDASLLGNYLSGTEYRVTIASSDYTLGEAGYITIDIFVVKLLTEFAVENNGKIYDGEAVTAEDFKISAENTAYTLDYDSFKIVSAKLNGVETEIREAGVYTVTIAVDDLAYDASGKPVSGSHVGTYTFEYTVSKQDISSSITISNNNPTYSATGAGAVAYFGDNEILQSDVVYAYYSYDKKTYLGALPPASAGSYKVVVTIADTQARYTGSKEFDYTVHKLEIGVSVDKQYNVVYGNSYSIVPAVGGSVDSTEVVITYLATGHTYATEDKPADAGTYRVTVTINNPNLTGTATSTLIISPAATTCVLSPKATAITYGTELRTSTLSGGTVESVYGGEVKGTFEFADSDKKDTPVGKNNVKVIFKPENSNYAECELTVSLTVNKAEMAILIGKTEYYYTGEPLTPEILSDVRVKFSYRQDGMAVASAVNAGLYTVTVTVDEANYAGSTVVEFTVRKAKAIVDESTAPTASAVIYGSKLSTGVISGGGIVYVAGKGTVNGSFTYVNGDTVLGDVGLYHDVPVVFTPYDTDNYEPYYITLDVNVAKATAQITVSECKFVYGETITKPTFTTSPSGLTVINTAFDLEIYGGVKDAGSYEYTASIEHKNYKGSITYQVSVLKKTVRVAYYEDEVPVSSYNAQYGAAKRVKAHILASDLVAKDSPIASEIESYMSYRYYSTETDYNSMVNPTSVGNYKVYTILDHKNYAVDKDDSTVNYNIVKANVKSVTLDNNTLSNQIYGSVVYPKVSTDPVGVSYRLEFPGYGDTMPTAAGNYNIKVIIEDPNYKGDTITAMFRINPKEISVENIKAYGKPADGLADVKVTGDLKGVMAGDEVSVIFDAETEGGKTGAGTYGVYIKSWTLRGLHAGNYVLREPSYKLSVTITNRTVYDNNSGAYITSGSGFSDNITLEVGEVYDVVNQTNFFTSLWGQSASVQAITIKDSGLNTVLSQKIKFYVKIPEKYRNSESLEVKGRGGLEDVTFEREGDFITFYSDCSGEVMFYVNDFPYWIIVVAGAVLILIIGALLIVFVSPVRRRKRIPAGARSAHDLGNSVKGYDVKYERKMKAKREEQKRRWKY